MISAARQEWNDKKEIEMDIANRSRQKSTEKRFKCERKSTCEM